MLNDTGVMFVMFYFSGRPPQQQYSALTTVLMDDSPLKAVLQPWNHLCISEYELERRTLDVRMAAASEREPELVG